MRAKVCGWAAALAVVTLGGLALPAGSSAASLAGPRYLAFSTNRSGGKGGFDIAIHDRLTGNELPLTTLNTAENDSLPFLSADAVLLACASGDRSRLFAPFRLADEALPGVSGGLGNGSPTLSASGDIVAFQVSRGQSAPRPEVFHRSLSRYLTPEAAHSPHGLRDQPALSPDGGWLAYRYRNEKEGVRGRIVLHSLAEPRVVSVPAQADMDEYAEPALSDDGRLVAFSARRGSSPDAWEVFVYDRRSQKVLATPGLSSGSADARPSFSRDGHYLACETQRGGTWDVLLYDLRRRELVPLPGVNTSAAERQPALSLE